MTERVRSTGDAIIYHFPQVDRRHPSLGDRHDVSESEAREYGEVALRMTSRLRDMRNRGDSTAALYLEHVHLESAEDPQHPA